MTSDIDKMHKAENIDVETSFQKDNSILENKNPNDPTKTVPVFHEETVEEPGSDFNQIDMPNEQKQKIEIRSGVSIDTNKLQLCSRASYSRLTSDLLAVIFSTDELSSCSLTGKMSNAHSSKNVSAKPALDAEKVRGIIDYVTNCFPDASEKNIRQIITNKLKYESFKRNGRCYLKEKHVNKESTEK
ncbi:hypothetical protein JTE90_007793 [Oedothorax gibbosus]|uniref:BEN domain-containing protein n=1 Tax=Oedothorax gibbosus TaxID=931172 RepID=A0AAV6UDI5_9ARAC|nr:hypothetical protein JTE90_007793 [Oedothorax gibbosus]